MLAKRLVQLRNALGLTQEEISLKLNISRGTYAHYEIGKRNPDYETLRKIADFFSVTTDYLLGRTDNLKPLTPNDPDDDIQPTPPERIRTFQKKIGELSPESLSFLEFQLEKLRELDLQAVERRRAKRDAKRDKEQK